MTDLVVGATGVVGGKICAELIAHGRAVRALVRETSAPDTVQRLRDMGVSVMVGDLKSKASLDAACVGADTVYSTASAIGAPKEGDSFDSVDVTGQHNLIESAKAAGAKRIVYISILGVTDDYPLGRAKIAVENALRVSGVPYTILQSSVFMDSWLAPEMGFDFRSGQVAVFGDGTTRMGWIHSTDVARIAVAAGSASEAHNATLHVTGPESLTPLEVVAAFETATGRSFDVSLVPDEALAEQRAGASNPWEETFAALSQRYAQGDPHTLTPLPAALDLPRMSVAEYARVLVAAG